MHVNAADTLIVKHPALTAYRDQLAGTRGGADAASGARSAEGGAPLAGTQDPYLTVEGLKKAWGQESTSYDLNGDGTVDVQDLLKLLSMGDEATDPNAPITVEGMMKDWGTTNSVYDLDHDGAVNVNDLMMLLAEGGEMAAPPPPPETRAASPGDDRVQGATPVAGPTSSGDASVPEPAASPVAADTSPSAAVKTEHAVRTMSDLLISRLERAGYTHRPPANVHGILDQFNFKNEHRQSIIDRIAQRYPNGLGIQVRA